ncbi:hypothetical protein EU546_00935 [Candidatus Thorarchaeota archaeon]|nr:MAG: hypothetical protein EU546_00935 [Candidatus Thorarchaeota archaeon]
MLRKHAMVAALLLVMMIALVGQMDHPSALAIDHKSTEEVGPQESNALAEGLVPEEPLRLNVIENPSFEEWEPATSSPKSWYAQASAYISGDAAYTSVVANGAYSGYVEAYGSPQSYGSSYLYNHPSPSNRPMLEKGVSLSFNWNALSLSDLQIGAQVYAFVIAQNGLGDDYYFLYFLCSSATHTTSGSWARIDLNDTINQWNGFDQNVTEDFIAEFGAGALTSSHYVAHVYLYVDSPNKATEMAQAVFDDVVLYNSTYTGFLSNGDFETGTGSAWYSYDQAMGHVGHSTNSTLDSYSVNITVANSGTGSGWARCYKSFSTTNEYYALYSGMTMVEVDWKYSDEIGLGASQYAYLRFTFGNGSIYQVHLYFGSGYMSSNTSSNFYLMMPGYNIRDTWLHSSIDLYTITNQLGLVNVGLEDISLYTYQNVPGATNQLLVDKLEMITYPAAVPTFEYDSLSGDPEPFLGWARYTSTVGTVTKTTDSHSGTTACNLTVTDQEDGVYRSNIFVGIDSKLRTDFWWRLDQAADSGGIFIELEFFSSTSFYHIRYFLGKSGIWNPSNTSSYTWILADGFNQTDTWANFARNITADLEDSFGLSPSAVHLSGILLYANAPPGKTWSCIFDDIHFMDMEAPVISTVDQSVDPVYYELTRVSVEATDARPGVSSIIVNYTTDSWSSWSTVSASYVTGDWFDAYIPAQPYGTDVEYYVIATDGCGLRAIDDNGGLFYTFTVDDDIDPTLTITNPANNTDQEGLLAITADVDDGGGSGIDYVTFNPDGSSAINDYTAPYSQNWDLDDASLGSHFIIVTVHDNAGNSATKTHYITVVDTASPVVSSPDDVVMTVGDIGEQVNWSISDVRPHNYTVYENGTEYVSGSWSAESYWVSVSLDGYLVGGYNLTLVIYDDAGNWASDTVLVTVNEEVTTTTTATTTTTTTTTGTTTPTTTPTGGGDPLLALAVVGVVAVVGVLLVIFVVIPRMKGK